MSSKKQNKNGSDKIPDISKTIISALFWIRFLVVVEYVLDTTYRIATKILQPLSVIGILVFLLFGIWSDDLKLLRISGTIFLSIGIIMSFLTFVVNLYGMFSKNSKQKSKPVPLTKEASDYLILSFFENKFKTDEIYRKKLADLYLSFHEKDHKNNPSS